MELHDGVVTGPIGDGMWTVSARCARRGAGPMEVVELVLRPTGEVPRGGLTTRVFRDVRLPAIVAIAEASEPIVDAITSYVEAVNAAAEAIRDHKPRTPYPDELYFVVAVAYVNAANDGATDIAGTIARELSEAFDADLEVGLVHNWIRAARRRRFLGEASQGRAAPTAGPRLADWMKAIGADS